MPKNLHAAADQADSNDLISFLKASLTAASAVGCATDSGTYAGGGARDPQWLQEIPRSGGLCQASPGSAQLGAGPEFQALAFRCHLSVPVPLRGSLTATTSPPAAVR